MSSITNINNNSSVVNVGRTTPVSPGQQPASKSIPVVVASDQPAIPVEEQNKIQSEVALSLLGIPRSEVALGIFADVNTYDVNPTEWSSGPAVYISGHGTKHLPEEAGALVEAPRDATAVLTSKRFFRYQPGRVSAATFGVKNTVSANDFARNPVIRKSGIFDKYDGYYWETRQSGKGDNFAVIRRTQSLYRSPVTAFGVQDALRGSQVDPNINRIEKDQTDDYRISGKPSDSRTAEKRLKKERQVLINNRFKIYEAAWTEIFNNTESDSTYAAFVTNFNSKTPEEQDIYRGKCERDVDYWIDMILFDVETSRELNVPIVDAHTAINTRNYESSLAVANRAAEYEVTLHTAVRLVIEGQDFAGSGDLLRNQIAVSTYNEIYSLYSIVVDFFTRVNDPAGFPSTSNFYAIPTSYGNKPIIETLFDARGQYWAYYVSEFTESGVRITYDEVIGGENEQIIKNKCQRDVKYIIDGYKNDISGGGNGETKYNASMYYKGNGLSIYSQVDGLIPREIERHTHLKNLIIDALERPVSQYGGEDFSDFVPRIYNGTLLGGNGLANIIIRNFTVEDTSTTYYGSKAFAGNLVVMRDGLPLIHAGVYDPSLLKEQKRIICRVRGANITVTDGTVTFGQFVKWVGVGNGGLLPNKVYQVKQVLNPKGNEFVLKDPDTGEDIQPADETLDGEIILVVPFIFPKAYDPAVVTSEQGSYGYPAGAMFPYMYTTGSGNLPVPSDKDFIGYIDTGINPATVSGSQKIRTQYDSVNFTPEWINWVKNNVDPEYYGVYEYRVPRSRFSTDKLNNALNLQVYSDVATGTQGKVRPGQPVIDETGVQTTVQSVYNFDFTKVTMLKIEFSWYGAVGALFLAYVPVGNGEARWVRVHHLRASNQMKIPSLGNATLPITYNVYGGGSGLALGDEEDTFQGYTSTSHHIVKYGASYYIDGGDRGTVRLYSNNNEYAEDVYGRLVDMGTPTYLYDSTLEMFYFERTPNVEEIPNVFFMRSTCKSDIRSDSVIEVAWTTAQRIYLSSEPQGSFLQLVTKRANTVYGIETKPSITSSQGQKVRNRVQVYPIKLSTGNIGTTTTRVTIKKSPIYQADTQVNATFTLTSEYRVTAENNPLSIAVGDLNYMVDGEFIYGWFRGRVESVSDSIPTTILVKLERRGNEYFASLVDRFDGTAYLSGVFLPDSRFNAVGQRLTTNEKTVSEKEGLSSVVIAVNSQVSIPSTGINIATLYVQPGTDQFDLSTYFDYNKEYLSYPLTDNLESIYFEIDNEEVSPVNAITSSGLISLGVTWEEQ